MCKTEKVSAPIRRAPTHFTLGSGEPPRRWAVGAPIPERMRIKLHQVLICALVAWALTGISNAQNCKYEKDEIDKFDKKRRLVTREVKLFGFYQGAQWNRCTVNGKMIGEGNRYLELYYLCTPSEALVVGHNSQLALLLSNGTTLYLSPVNTYAGEISSNSNGSLSTHIYPAYILTNEDFTLLKQHTVQAIRITFTDSKVDRDLKENVAADLQAIIKCLE